MERDQDHSVALFRRKNFNPRAPHGARRLLRQIIICQHKFQSTRSAWSATYAPPVFATTTRISIHALRMERDNLSTRKELFKLYFNPRAPHGARRR